MTHPSISRESLIEALHKRIDGDFLVVNIFGSAGVTTVPMREARAHELVWWAADALIDFVDGDAR